MREHARTINLDPIRERERERDPIIFNMCIINNYIKPFTYPIRMAFRTDFQWDTPVIIGHFLAAEWPQVTFDQTLATLLKSDVLARATRWVTQHGLLKWC